MIASSKRWQLGIVALALFVAFTIVSVAMDATADATPTAQQERPHGITGGHKCKKHSKGHKPKKCQKKPKKNKCKRGKGKCGGKVHLIPPCQEHLVGKTGSSIMMMNCLPEKQLPEELLPIDESNDPCAFMRYGCEPFVVKNMEVFEVKGKGSSIVWGCAHIQAPFDDELEISFHAKHGSFESWVYGWSKYSSFKQCSPYIPPQHPWTTPDDGLDEAWAVVINSTQHTYLKSESTVFNFEEPDVVYEVGEAG